MSPMVLKAILHYTRQHDLGIATLRNKSVEFGASIDVRNNDQNTVAPGLLGWEA
jgi:hypothetical protein